MGRARSLLAVFLLCGLIAGLAASVFANSPVLTETQREQILHRLSDAAIERTGHTARYDPGYVHIRYPGGDVPPDTGVCTDEVIRSYRALGIDLRREVHEDMHPISENIRTTFAGC